MLMHAGFHSLLRFENIWKPLWMSEPHVWTPQLDRSNDVKSGVGARPARCPCNSLINIWKGLLIPLHWDHNDFLNLQNFPCMTILLFKNLAL